MANGIEIYKYSGAGYKPLIYSHDWMVALLNYEDIMGLDKAVDIERHVQTDEVFILLKGRATFYLVAEGQPMQVKVPRVDMRRSSSDTVQPGKIAAHRIQRAGSVR